MGQTTQIENAASLAATRGNTEQLRQRARVGMRVEVFVPIHRSTVIAVIKDVAAVGCFVEPDEPLPDGSKLLGVAWEDVIAIAQGPPGLTPPESYPASRAGGL